MLEFDYRKASLYAGALYHYNGRVVYNDTVAVLALDAGYSLASIVTDVYYGLMPLAWTVETAMQGLEVFGCAEAEIKIEIDGAAKVIGRVRRERMA